jgi:prepilin-type N-terminal cleavage/methylation domain-containing protein
MRVAHTRLGRQPGFTLLELTIVLLILGLSLAVTYPALQRGNASLQLRSAGRDVLNCLRYAREKAITEGAGSRVVFNRENQTATLTDAYGDGARTLTLPRDVRIARLVFAGQEVPEGGMMVRFLPNGSAEHAEIVLEVPRTGATLVIATDPITGGARMVTEADRRRR